MTGSALSKILSVAKSTGIDTRSLYQSLSARSIRAAAREQDLDGLMSRMRETLPDIADQYSYGIDPAEYDRYWETKLRALHAFQIRSALDAVARFSKQNLTIVDIGDSSGNHGLYLKALAPENQIGRVISINLDPVAVEKIRKRGGEAHLVRAEELDLSELAPDFLMCFETLEHLTDPLRFLHRLAENPYGEHLLVSVPYRQRSRFGGKVLDRPIASLPAKMTPEELHILELSPADWSRMARLAGYETAFLRIYRQYPRFGVMRFMAPVWRSIDFEGFICLYLKRDLSISQRYTGW